MESVSNQNFTGDEGEFTKVLFAVAEAKSCSYVQFIRIWQVLWRLTWNHWTTTLHPSETSGIAERAARRAKEATSAVLLQSGSDDRWWLDSMECCCCLRDDQDLLADVKSQNERRLGESFADMLCSRGEFWEENILIAQIEELEKIDASEIYPRRPNAKEVLSTQQNGEFVFLVADGSAKLSGRDYEFQEPTLRREYTVKKENLSGESHGEREEFRPEETKDDEGINKDFWAHAEARKQFYFSSSCWTEKFNLRAERRIILYF